MSERLSRGEIISLLAGIPTAVALTAETASAAPPNATTTQIGKSLAYVNKSTHAGQSCSDCRFFKATSGGNGTCQLIPNATVKAAGWCKSWTKKS